MSHYQSFNENVLLKCSSFKENDMMVVSDIGLHKVAAYKNQWKGDEKMAKWGSSNFGGNILATLLFYPILET